MAEIESDGDDPSVIFRYLESTLYLFFCSGDNAGCSWPQPTLPDARAHTVLFADDPEKQRFLQQFVNGLETYSLLDRASATPGIGVHLLCIQFARMAIARHPESVVNLSIIDEGLAQLQDQLRSLNDSQSHPSLRPRSRRRGRPKTSQWQLNFKLRCVYAAKLQEDVGKSRREANRVVARAAAATARIVLGDRPHQPFGETMLQNWRDDVSARLDQEVGSLEQAYGMGYELELIHERQEPGRLNRYAAFMLQALRPEFIDLSLKAVKRALERRQASG